MQAFNGFQTWVQPVGSFRPELETPCTWCQKDEEGSTDTAEGEGAPRDNTTLEARVLLERVIVSQIMRSVASMIRVSKPLDSILDSIQYNGIMSFHCSLRHRGSAPCDPCMGHKDHPPG